MLNGCERCNSIDTSEGGFLYCRVRGRVYIRFIYIDPTLRLENHLHGDCKPNCVYSTCTFRILIHGSIVLKKPRKIFTSLANNLSCTGVTSSCMRMFSEVAILVQYEQNHFTAYLCATYGKRNWYIVFAA